MARQKRRGCALYSVIYILGARDLMTTLLQGELWGGHVCLWDGNRWHTRRSGRQAVPSVSCVVCAAGVRLGSYCDLENEAEGAVSLVSASYDMRRVDCRGLCADCAHVTDAQEAARRRVSVQVRRISEVCRCCSIAGIGPSCLRERVHATSPAHPYRHRV